MTFDPSATPLARGPQRSADSATTSQELLERVVREVLARLAPEAIARSTARPIQVAERVVTVATITGLPAATRQIELAGDAIVTPAAVDEAKHRGIAISRGMATTAGGAIHGRPAGQSNTEPTSGPRSRELRSGESRLEGPRVSGSTVGDSPPPLITDREHPARAESVLAQLARRGIHGNQGVKIVLSDHPAKSLHEETIAGRRVAMVRRYADVDRFAAELQPDCWVLDMVDLNPVATVNAAQRILQLKNPTR